MTIACTVLSFVIIIHVLEDQIDIKPYIWTPALKMQKEVCDGVRSMCSLDLAWQSALRQG